MVLYCLNKIHKRNYWKKEQTVDNQRKQQYRNLTIPTTIDMERVRSELNLYIYEMKRLHYFVHFILPFSIFLCVPKLKLKTVSQFIKLNSDTRMKFYVIDPTHCE